MKQTEKKEVDNFVLNTLSDGNIKTGTQLMELFVAHSGLQQSYRTDLTACHSANGRCTFVVFCALDTGLRKGVFKAVSNNFGDTKGVASSR